MKKQLIIGALTSSLSFAAQVDYYDFQDNVILSSPAHTTKSTGGTDLVTDGAGKFYYVHNDGEIHYLNKTGANWYDTDMNSTPVNTDNGLLYAMWKVFYVDNTGKVSNMYQSAGNWYPAVLNYSAPTVLSGCNITVDGSGTLYYAAASNGKIQKLWWNGSSWLTAQLSVPEPYQAKTGNKILFSTNHIYFIGTDNKVWNLFLDSGGNWHAAVLNSGAPLAMDGTSLFEDVYGKVYYIAQDGSICNFIYSGGWFAGALSLSAPKAKATGDFLVNNNSEIYYVTDVNGYDQIFCLIWADCKWFWTSLKTNATPVKNYSGLLMDNAKTLYFVGGTDNKMHTYSSRITNELTHPYVYIKSKDLMFQGQKYKPKVLNYSIDLNTDNNGASFYPSPWKNNFNCCFRYSNNPSVCLQKIRDDFNYIKNTLGYDAIRMVGPGVTPGTGTNANVLEFTAVVPGVSWGNDLQRFSYNTYKTANLTIVRDLINEAENYGLRVIYLTGSNASRNNMVSAYNTYLSELSAFIGNEPNLLAYDVYNEPANDWATNDMSKSDICAATDLWYNTIRTNCNNLVTLGQFGINDVHAWDPGVQTIDFYSCHIYDYNRSDLYANKLNRVKGEMYWYSNNLNKPWILGESGYSADPYNTYSLDDGSTTEQNNFAQDVLNLTVQGGAVGYSWWAFHDDINQAPGSYYGLIYNDPTNPLNVPVTSFSPHNYLQKPVTSTIKNFNLNQTCSGIAQPANYFDPYNNSAQPQVYGTIVDENNKPIRDAVIMQWPAIVHTYTDANGSFHMPLLSSNANRHLKISAQGREAKTVFIGTGSPSSFGTTQLLKVPACNNYTHRFMSENSESVSSLRDSEEISVFPNPAGNIVSIKGARGLTKIEFVNVAGEVCKVVSAIGNGENLVLDCLDLANGIYFVRICDTNKRTITKKLVVSR